MVGAALNFMTFYKDTYSDLIETPSILVANLLLMGDRMGPSNSNTTRFDQRWGAGRMKMRKWDTDGLDNPAYWSTGSVCVGHGETITLSINNGSSLSNDVDYIKGVIHWHDERHDINGTVDDIDLRLKTTSNTTRLTSAIGSSNKERIFYANP